MKKELSMLSLAVITLSTVAVSAQAGFMDKLSDIAQVVNIASDINNAVTSDQSNNEQLSTDNDSNNQGTSVPIADISAKSECTNDMIWGVYAGYDKPYSGNDKGTSYSSRGFLDYVSSRGTSRCDLPQVQSPRCLYFQTKESAFINAGGDKLEMQCFYEDDPQTLITDKNLYPHNVHYFEPEEIVIRCGNDKGVEGCVSGDDATRAKQHISNLSENSAKDFSVCLTPGPQTRQMYCQYVNPETNRSLFKIQYTQRPN